MKTAIITVCLLLVAACATTPPPKTTATNPKRHLQVVPSLRCSDLQTGLAKQNAYNAQLQNTPPNLEVNMLLERQLPWSGTSTTPDGNDIYTFTAIVADEQGESYRTGKVRVLNGKAEVLEMHLL